MRERSALQLFIHYISRSVLSMLGLSCYILADTFFVANGVGSMGIAALNIALPIYSLISGTAIMIGMGAATRYCIYIGENRKQDASVCFTHALMLCIGIGLLFTIFFTIFSENIAMLLGAKGDVLPLAGKYIKTISSFSLAFLFNQVFICFVRNDEQPSLAMSAMLTGSFANVILDYIFIFPLKMGMFGAAFATGLAPILSMAILSRHLSKKQNRFHIAKCKVSPILWGRMISVGFPSFITEASSGAIMAVLNILILNASGSLGVAAYGIIANLALIVIAVFTGVAQGIQPIVSMNIGMGNHKSNRTVLQYGLILATAFGALFYGGGVIFGSEIIALFNSEQNETLAQLAKQGIWLYFPAFFMMGVNILVSAYLAACSRPFPSFVICIARGLIGPIVFALLFSRFFHMPGIWVSIPAAEGFTLLVSGYFIIREFRISTGDLHIRQ